MTERVVHFRVPCDEGGTPEKRSKYEHPNRLERGNKEVCKRFDEMTSSSHEQRLYFS